MYWWWPESWDGAFIYTIKSFSLIHGLDSRSFLMELVFAACCFVFPVWALSLQSYEGDHEDDFDFLWKLWLDTAKKILFSLQINGLLHGGVLVLKRGLFVLRAFSLRYHCGISILATPWDLDGIPRWGRTQRRAINAVFIPSSLRQGDARRQSPAGKYRWSHGTHHWGAPEELREVQAKRDRWTNCSSERLAPLR